MKSSHHQSPIEALFQQFSSSKIGLTADQVVKNRERYGANEIAQDSGPSVVKLIVKQFNSLLIWVLIAAAVISLFTGHEIDAYVIFAIVVINAFIGFSQEYRAEQAVAALQKMLVSQARVIRDGEQQKIPARELVPGDVILLEEGDAIPADARLFSVSNLRCIEASLTGESVPVEKKTDELPEATPLADRHNMVWKGTFVAAGSAKAIVTATGNDTALGEIATSLKSISAKLTNFQKKTKVLARQMAIIAIVLSLVLFSIAYFIRDFLLAEVFLVTIATMVSAIPEGLPAILSIVLAIGANRMARRNAIIREFTATETLGAITTILTDKTGTLTQSVLLTERLFVPGENALYISGQGYEPHGQFLQNDQNFSPLNHSGFLKAMEIAGFAVNARLKKEGEKWDILGDPTEGALLVMAQKAGLPYLEKSDVELLADLPFNSDLKMRASLLHYPDKGKHIEVIGAPEKVLDKCTHLWQNGQAVALSAEAKAEILQVLDAWSEQAFRVIALATKPVMEDLETLNLDDLNGLAFCAFAGMTDPPRPEVKDAIANCKMAGIRVIMATGDHKKTAAAIGENIGISATEGALDQTDLEKLSDKEFEDAVARVNIFARLTPAMKLRIAETLQNQGQLIAMTGDGVNDAPALKRADVGIAMGISGTDVARGASQMVLADDNFASIVNAIEEGRIVFTNARLSSFFLLTTNFAEVLTLIVAVSIGLPIPLTATQILWLNLVTDGVSGLALATEPGHGDILKQKPVNRRENILNRSVMPFMIINAAVMMTLALGSFYYFLPEGETKARTAAFIVMAFTQLFNLINMRHLKRSAFSIGIFSNKWVNLALIASVILQVMVVEMPYFKNIFRVQRLEIMELISLVALSGLVFVGGEVYKFMRNRLLVTRF